MFSDFQPLGVGTTIQDLEDFIVSNNLLPLGSLMYLLFCTSRYGWGWKGYYEEVNSGKGLKLPSITRFYISYILPLIVNPFNIFLFRQVFVSLPDDVYEAAQLDFCGPVKYFFTMVLPMSKTVVATVSVFTFLNVWNDYLWPSLVFTSSDLLTAQIGLNSITSNENTTMGQTLAVITLITIPVIIIYSLFSKQIVEGVTSTGSKEG